MGEHPAQAIRRKKDASIVVATRLVKDGLCAAVVAAGYQARIIARRTQAVEDVKIPYLRFGVALLIAFLSEGLDIIEEYQVDVLPLSGETIAILSLVLAVVAILMAGLGTLKEGIKCLFRWEFNMMTLMAVAVIGAVLIGAWPEAAMVMVLFEISETIEDLCMTCLLYTSQSPRDTR